MSCELTESQKKTEKHETSQVQRSCLENVAYLLRKEAADHSKEKKK